MGAEEELVPEQHERIQPSLQGRRVHPLLEQPPPRDAQPDVPPHEHHDPQKACLFPEHLQRPATAN